MADAFSKLSGTVLQAAKNRSCAQQAMPAPAAAQAAPLQAAEVAASTCLAEGYAQAKFPKLVDAMSENINALKSLQVLLHASAAAGMPPPPYRHAPHHPLQL